ncbi:hypothetical protein MKW92_018352 [Papaver armeniacum]|nr:hypothetical protein MKW92_018352 [Papaver armeniacum]
MKVEMGSVSENVLMKMLLLLGCIVVSVLSQESTTLVPAIITFGDSAVDVGNNDYLPTLFKANYPPYGRDFANKKPTGRFCNGKLATDITAETLGFTTYPPAYLSPQASGKNLLIGANFASAASGYYDKTAIQSNLYGLGARRIGVTSLPPLGCLPAMITLMGHGEQGCVARLNTDAQGFNKKVGAATAQLQKKFPDLKIAIFDIYTPFLDLVQSPAKNGFTEAKKGCCGTGTVETTSFLCNVKSPGTCSNATQYVFFDAVHPSQAANQVLADALILQGISLIG